MSNNSLNWNVDLFETTDIKYQAIGKISSQLVDFIISKKPEFKGRISDTNDILFWKSRKKHTEKHIKDFDSEEQYREAVKNIPNIIAQPDYISIHPTDDSVSFIKKYDKKNVHVAIKISVNGDQVYRTMYPLRESQLKSYIKNNRAWKV